MAFRTMFEAGYAAFIDENCDGGDLWFFLHIPKTAGSSFRAEMAKLLSPNHNIQLYDGSEDPFEVRRARAIRAFADATPRLRFRFASGHVPFSLMTPLMEMARPPKLFTMLRDPVARVISDFRYQSTPQHPDHEVFRARCPTIEHYLDLAGERDKMMHFLAPRNGAGVDETVGHVLDTFAAIGSMETYDASFAVMMDLIDAERTPSMILRRTDSRAAPPVRLTPALLTRIREANAGDVALYERLAPYLARVSQLREAALPIDRNGPERGFSAWRFV